MTNVVVFCGGRGSTTILTSLARTRNVDLSVIVNAYDSGLSTGRVRRAFPGMLGPSDIRKTAATLATATDVASRKILAALLEVRLPSGDGPKSNAEERARAQLAALIGGEMSQLDHVLADAVRTLALETWLPLRDSLASFEKSLVSANGEFHYHDLALGNAVIGGLFAHSDFEKAVGDYQRLLGLDGTRVLNVSQGEDLWLSARTELLYCPDEGTLVTTDPPTPITDLFLLPRHDHDRVYGGRTAWLPQEDVSEDPADAEQLPFVSSEVLERVQRANVIVYGPGTQHSSLFPTYLTVGLGEAIAANENAEKLFVANIGRDRDQHPDETIDHILKKFTMFMSRRGAVNLQPSDLITSILVPDEAASVLPDALSGIHVRRAVWADPSGRHSGPAVQEEIASVVRLRTGEKLLGDSGLVTVIVPVLNELPRLPKVLQQLRFLDLTDNGLVHEIVVVDGGSTDGTLDLLRNEQDITLIEAFCKGRGDAVRVGLQRARGEYVVVFPGDDEYPVSTVGEVVAALRRDGEAVVLASRTLGGFSARNRLRAVYEDKRGLYVLSHWGGIAITLLLMIKLDRIVSDPLSGVRGACRDVFRQVDNTGSGLDYEVLWVRRAVAEGRIVLEVPTPYRPRSWHDGKKTTIWDGFRALLSVFRKDES